MNWVVRSTFALLASVLPVTAAEPVWDRLTEHFFVRRDAAGHKHGRDSLDPLLWPSTKHLVTGESHAQAIRLLDEILALPQDAIPTNSWQRALLQRDLWAVFDWVAQAAATPEQRQLQDKLARVLRRLTLTSADRAALPDNYEAAVQAGTFPRLPAGILVPKSEWVLMGISGSSVAAARHVEHFGARSVFAVLLRVPAGRQAGVNYLHELRAAAPTNLPPLAAGTEWALVRRMLVLGDDGKIHASPVTESIQLRRYPKPSTNRPEVAEFILSRARGGALREVATNETEFIQFMAHDYDPVESDRDGQVRVLDMCLGCHSQPGVQSVLAFTRAFSPYTAPAPVDDLSFEREVDLTRQEKYRRYDWGLLEGLLRRP